ncbi:MAG: zinc metalloprotease [Nocardioidaceae bacterium]|nr:zinc metalloprotease [Nocardioidaceae bacterium]
MSFLSSPALRRVAQLVGTGAAAALVATSLGAGTAAAAIDSGAIDCVVPTTASKTVPTTTVQRDPVGPTVAEAAAMERDFEARKAALGFDIDLEDIRDPINVDVYYHVVHKDGTVKGGNIPRTMLRAQTKYMNKSFRGHGFGEPGARTPFHFNFAGADRTKNADWYNNAHPPGFAPDSKEIEMKTALREPGSTAETLNVYTANLLNVGLLGYAYFPSSYDNNPPISKIRDGVVVETQSLPGGSAAPYDLGGTLTHEVGHYVGLYHTFQEGCSEPGDRVEDTPPQGEPTSGCPEGQDTCPAPGNDPIHNYMDYSYDACYNQFTIGQRERAIDQWYTYRDGVA